MGIHKRYYAFLIALPAMLVVLILRIPAVIIGLILPFERFNILKGLIGSSWAGFDNFKSTFLNYNFWNILKNTLILNLCFLILAVLISLVIGFSLAQVKFSWLYRIFSLLFVIPLFIPQAFWSALLLKYFGEEWKYYEHQSMMTILMDSEFARSLYISIEILRWTGLFAVLIAFAVKNAPVNKRMNAALMAALSIALVSSSFILATDFELLKQITSVYARESLDTLTIYCFWVGIKQANYSSAGVLWFLQFLFCIIILALLLFKCEGFIKNSLFPKKESNLSGQFPNKVVTSIGAIMIPGIFSLLLLLIIGILINFVTGIGKYVTMSLFIKSGITYSLLAFISSFIGVLLSALLAYPFTTASPQIRRLYTFFFLILIAAGQFFVQDYIYYYLIGIKNTFVSIVLADMFNPVTVILLGIFYSQKVGDPPSDFRKYLIKSLPAIACIFIGSFLLNADSYTSSLLYTEHSNMQSPTMQFIEWFRSHD